MKRITLWAIVALLLAALACGGGATETPTEPPVATETVQATETQETQISPVAPTLTATQGPSATPPPTFVPSENLLKDPGFEGEVRPVIFGQVWTFEDWWPFYCDEPQVPGGCAAWRIGEGNPEGLRMGRPEFKPTEIENRVKSGDSAQQWFCFFRACAAGVYQVVETIPGAEYEASAWVQSWSAGSPVGTSGVNFTSWTATEDDRDNSIWRIVAGLDGQDYPYLNGNFVASQYFGYEAGHFDEYALISFRFIATGRRTSVFFENVRIWPFQHNDSYLDDVGLRMVAPPPSASPTPTSAPPTPTATATPSPTATLPGPTATLPSVTATETLEATPTPMTTPGATPIIVTPIAPEPFAQVQIASLRIRSGPYPDAAYAEHPEYGLRLYQGQVVRVYGFAEGDLMPNIELHYQWLQLDEAGLYWAAWVHPDCDYLCANITWEGYDSDVDE